MLIGNSESREQTNSSGFIKDVTSESFMKEVVEESKNTPVIVDFWAPWCGPCKDLGPLIEKAVKNCNGKVILAKVNIDENQAIAAQLRVQSIPTVYAFSEGQPVDGFNGAQPESVINEFVNKISELNTSGPNIEEMIQTANEELKEKNFQNAGDIFEAVLSNNPEKHEAIAGLIRVFTGLKKNSAAQELIQSLDSNLKEKSAIKEAMIAFDLLEKSSNDIGNTEKLIQLINSNPNDLQARQDLALALYGSGEVKEALDCLLESINIDPDWNEQAARKQLVDFFSAIGLTDPIVVTARKRLSALIFK